MALQVTTAASGEAALGLLRDAAAAGQPFDLAVIDWQMPQGMSGLDLARAVQQLPASLRPHMVMLTAYAREGLIEEATRVGLEYVLAKPVNASLLFETILGVLSLDDTRTAPTASGATRASAADLSTVRGARILLAEDNPLNQQIACELLADEGLVVEVLLPPPPPPPPPPTAAEREGVAESVPPLSPAPLLALPLGLRVLQLPPLLMVGVLPELCVSVPPRPTPPLLPLTL